MVVARGLEERKMRLCWSEDMNFETFSVTVNHKSMLVKIV